MAESLTIEKRPELDEIDLIRRAQLEDTSAYEELVRRYYSKIYGLVYGMTSSREDAEDVTQEVFVKAWKALGHFREQASFFTWIYRIAINRAINFRKRRGQRKTLQFEEFDPDIKQAESYKEFSSKGSVLRKINLSEFQKKMNEALLVLSDKHRAVVVMHDVQGLSHAEIAGIMGGSEGTARSRLFYARKKLQVALADFAS